MIVPAPWLAAAVRWIDVAPAASVTVTWSLASDAAASETLTVTLAEVAALIQPPPLVTETLVGTGGGAPSAVAVAVALSTLERGCASLETACTLYV